MNAEENFEFQSLASLKPALDKNFGCLLHCLYETVAIFIMLSMIKHDCWTMNLTHHNERNVYLFSSCISVIDVALYQCHSDCYSSQHPVTIFSIDKSLIYGIWDVLEPTFWVLAKTETRNLPGTPSWNFWSEVEFRFLTLWAPVLHYRLIKSSVNNKVCQGVLHAANNTLNYFQL